MDVIGYETLYDIRDDWVARIFPSLLIAVPVALAAAFGRRLWRWLRQQSGGDIAVAVVAMSAFAALCGGAGASGLSEHRRLINLLDGGKALVVEGNVTDFVPRPPQGHDSEHWTVNGLDFAPEQFQSGHVHEGMRVRVSYVEDPRHLVIRPGDGRIILKIEAASDKDRSASN